MTSSHPLQLSITLCRRKHLILLVSTFIFLCINYKTHWCFLSFLSYYTREMLKNIKCATNCKRKKKIIISLQIKLNVDHHHERVGCSFFFPVLHYFLHFSVAIEEKILYITLVVSYIKWLLLWLLLQCMHVKLYFFLLFLHFFCCDVRYGI